MNIKIISYYKCWKAYRLMVQSVLDKEELIDGDESVIRGCKQTLGIMEDIEKECTVMEEEIE